MSKTAREILGEANVAREDGNFLNSLQLADEAAISFQQENDPAGFAESQAVRFLVFRHLFDETGDENNLILAKFAALSAAEIAERSGDKSALAIPYFNVGKVYFALKDFPQATAYHQKALDFLISNPPPSHNRSGVVADFKIHLAVCQYWNGDKTALQRLEEAIIELDASDEKIVSDYNYHVWKSGAFMEAAKMLRTDDPQLAKEYLQKAKVIIDLDSRLVLRKTQWDKLSKLFAQ